MTMEELASFLGVTHATISRLESGKIKKIRPDKAPLLAKYLEIPLETLISEKGQKLLEESAHYINKNNYSNCIIQDGMNNVQINSTSPTVSYLIRLISFNKPLFFCIKSVPSLALKTL